MNIGRLVLGLVAMALVGACSSSSLDPPASQPVTAPDADGDGIPDSVEGNRDPDNDGVPNMLDPDSDGDGIPDGYEDTDDLDGDGVPNMEDPDSDGDGFLDIEEGISDVNNNGVPDYLDGDAHGNGGVGTTSGPDADGDGIPDSVEGDGDADLDGIPNLQDPDSDGDGTPDSVEGAIDVNNNGIPDYLDTSIGSSSGTGGTSGVGGTGVGGTTGVGGNSSGLGGTGNVGGGPTVPPSLYGTAVQQSIWVTFEGQQQAREYWVMVPADYDESVPAALVFNWHGLNQTFPQTTTWLGVVGVASNAILVYPVAQNPSYGFHPYPDQEDFALYDALYAEMMATYNINPDRVFSVAHSNGAGINAHLGCDRGDQIRAAVNVAHFWESPPGTPYGCVDNTNWMFLYGLQDTVAPELQYPDNAINTMQFLTGCSDVAVPVAVNGMTCEDYTECNEGAGLRWCTHPGGHDWPGMAANTAIWEFFDQFQ